MSEAEDRAERFNISPDGLIMTQCVSCVHLAEGPYFICRAFPGLIPSAIVENRFDHRKPYPGDDGIRFEPKPDVSAEYLRSLGEYLDSDRTGDRP